MLHNTAYIEGNEPVRLGRDVIYATSEKRNTQKKGEVRLSTFVPTGARKASHDKVTLRTNNAITNIIFKPLLWKKYWPTQKKRVVQMVLLYLVIAYIVYWLYFILKDRFWSAIQVRPRPFEWNTEVSFRRLTPSNTLLHTHTRTHIVVCSS